MYGYYSRVDSTKEKLGCTFASSRLVAAKHFAAKKQLDLKNFVKLFKIEK